MQRNDDAQQHRFTRTILPQAPTTPIPTARPSLSGTGGALAAQAATNRAQDFAAGKVPLAEYASTLKAPDLTYQDNAISAKRIPTPGFSLLPEPEAEKQLRARGIVSRQPAGAEVVEGAQERTFGARGAASTPEERPIRSVLGSTPSSDAAPLSQQQRDAAGDAYRKAWQRQVPGGLENASASALGLYNAEQQVRGTGITAQRGPNGVMEFSGDGEGALPQSFTRGLDLNAANERMARANAIRQLQLDAAGGPKVGLIENGDRFNNIPTGGGSGGRAGRAQRALDLREQELKLREQELTGSQDYRSRDLAMREQELGLRSGTERERLGLERQRTESELQGRGYQNRRSEMELSLLDRIANPRSAEDAALATRQLAAIQGKNREDDAQVIYSEELINPAQPMAGTRRVPMLLNRDGTATAVTPRATPKALPQGVSRDSAIEAARRAIESGYNREAIAARLGEYGLTLEDIAR